MLWVCHDIYSSVPGRGQLDTLLGRFKRTEGLTILCEYLPVHPAATASGAVQPDLAWRPTLCSPVGPIFCEQDNKIIPDYHQYLLLTVTQDNITSLAAGIRSAIHDPISSGYVSSAFRLKAKMVLGS